MLRHILTIQNRRNYEHKDYLKKTDDELVEVTYPTPGAVVTLEYKFTMPESNVNIREAALLWARRTASFFNIDFSGESFAK